MSDLEDLNDFDDIEDDEYKSKKVIKDKKSNDAKDEKASEEKSEDNIFVTNNPKKSTDYKEQLLRIYNELEAITMETIQEEINEIKRQIMILLGYKNQSDEKIRELASSEMNKKLNQEKDLHYLPKTKPVIISKAKDEPFFTTTNILLMALTVSVMIVSLILLIKL